MRWMICVAMVSTVSMGCRASLGECDLAATQIVFEDNPTLGVIPMYDGQALMVQSCGAQNGNCHSSAAEGAGREAVPGGFNFDLKPLDQSVCTVDTVESPDCLAEQARLRTASQIAFDYQVLSWNEVAEERMPPGGAVAQAPRFYRSVSETGFADPLPGLDTEDGKDIFRNWVRCGQPIVGRVGDPSEGEPGEICDPDNEEEVHAYGECRVGSEPPSPPDSTWGGDNGIHEFLLSSGCAVQGCHGAGADNNSPTLGGDAMAVYDNLVDQQSADDQDCGGRTLIVPNDVAESLLYEKFSASPESDVCGDEMPAGADAPPDEFLAPIRAWIEAGANP